MDNFTWAADRASSCRLETSDAVSAAQLLVVSPLVVLVPRAAKIMLDRGEVSHPVFSLMLQELCFLFACVVASVTCFATSLAIDETRGYRVVSSAAMIMVGSNAVMFHQMTWLAITCLRYYILVRCPNKDNIDFKRLRIVSFAFVWIALPLWLTVTALISWLMVMGNQEISLETIENYATFDFTSGYYAAIAITTVSVNLPDLLSLAVYLKMLRHFRKTVAPEVDVPNAGNEPYAGNDPYAGIWMGGEELSVDDIENQNAIAHLNQAAENKKQQETESVMRVLKWHVLLSSVDAFVILLFVGYCHPVGKAAADLFQIACCLWVPFLVTGVHCLQTLKQNLSDFCSCKCF